MAKKVKLMRNRRKYVANACVALVAAGCFVTALFPAKNVLEDFPELNPLVEMRREAVELKYELSNKVELSPRELFEDDRALLNRYEDINSRLDDLKSKEEEFCARPEIKPKYEAYKEESEIMGDSCLKRFYAGLAMFTLGVCYLLKPWEKGPNCPGGML